MLLPEKFDVASKNYESKLKNYQINWTEKWGKANILICASSCNNEIY